VAIDWTKYMRRPSLRTTIALAAGLIWASAFPLLNFPIGAWIAPGLLLLTGLGTDPRAAFRRGYLAGLVFYLVSLYWLLHIPFPIGNISAWLALSGFCALYPATWMWVCWKTCPIQFDSATSTNGLGIGGGPIRLSGNVRQAADQLFNTSWVTRQVWILSCAISFTALEFTRGWFLTGFPWNFLGASQFRAIPLIQIAEFTGVQGVTFIVVWVSLSVAVGALLVVARPQIRFAWKNEIAPALLVMLILVSWGVTKTMRPVQASDRNITLALVQPSIPQNLIFDADESTNRFRQIMELSREALATDPDVLVWPEASLPVSLSKEFFAEIMELITTNSTPFIFGGLDWEEEKPTDGERKFRPYNSAFYFDEHGGHTGTYRKQRLVIFGEYTPFAKWFPLLGKIFPVGVGFGSGELPEPFIVGQQNARIAVNICFEDNFADVLRDEVKSDTDFVLNLTNNGWFSESAAQWQHAANAIFRAVENRVSMVRCTNNGLTCWIDEYGRLREIFRDENDSIYGRGIKTITLPLLPSGTERQTTLYHRYGDWFGWMCSAITVLAILRSRFKKLPTE